MAKTLAGAVKWIGIEFEIGLPQLVPQRKLLPCRPVADLLVVCQERVGQHDCHHLLVATVE
jgi:hypothetical protein